MVRYSNEGKEAILCKLLLPYNLSVYVQVREEGISKTTSDHWSAEAKLATVIETATLSEAELSAYCRE